MSAQLATIAVVDDGDSFRRALARLLRVSGYETRSYASAEEFLADDEGLRADCLVLDIQLGGMSGLDLQRRLAAAGSAPPVVFVTGHPTREHRERARAAGSIAFLAKPVTAEVLLEAVAAGVAARAAERVRAAAAGAGP